MRAAGDRGSKAEARRPPVPVPVEEVAIFGVEKFMTQDVFAIVLM